MQILCRKLLLTRVWLAKKKTPNSEQKTGVFPSSLKGEGGQWWNNSGWAGKGWSQPEPSASCTSEPQTSRNANVSWDGGGSLRGRDVFSHPGNSLYELSGHRTKKNQEQQQKHSGGEKHLGLRKGQAGAELEPLITR